MVSRAAVEALVERARYRGPTITADRLVGVDACLRQLGGQLALIARPELAIERRGALRPSSAITSLVAELRVRKAYTGIAWLCGCPRQPASDGPALAKVAM